MSCTLDPSTTTYSNGYKQSRLQNNTPISAGRAAAGFLIVCWNPGSAVVSGVPAPVPPQPGAFLLKHHYCTPRRHLCLAPFVWMQFIALLPYQIEWKQGSALLQSAASFQMDSHNLPDTTMFIYPFLLPGGSVLGGLQFLPRPGTGN